MKTSDMKRIHALTRRLYDAATPDAERERLRDQISRARARINLTFDVEAAMDQAEREELCHNK